MALSFSKKITCIIRGIKSKHQGDFYCLNSFHSFATENKCESHKNLYENNNFCNVAMPSEDDILEFNQYGNIIKYHLLFMLILNV